MQEAALHIEVSVTLMEKKSAALCNMTLSVEPVANLALFCWPSTVV